MKTLVSFAPLEPDAVALLAEETNVDFSRTDFASPRWFCVTARNIDGFEPDDLAPLMGVLACEFKTWFDVYFSTAICDPRCLSRRLLSTIFRTLFSQAIRITAEIEPDHQSAIDQCRRMGFVYEGFKRFGIEGRRDALQFGMLRDDCRFLPGYQPARATVRPTDLGGYHGLLS